MNIKTYLIQHEIIKFNTIRKVVLNFLYNVTILSSQQIKSSNYGTKIIRSTVFA